MDDFPPVTAFCQSGHERLYRYREPKMEDEEGPCQLAGEGEQKQPHGIEQQKLPQKENSGDWVLEAEAVFRAILGSVPRRRAIKLT